MIRHYLNQGWPRCWWIHASQACMCYTLLAHIISSQFQDSLYKQLLKNMWFISHILQELFTGTGQLPDCPSVSQSHQKNMGKKINLSNNNRGGENGKQCVKFWDVLSRDTPIASDTGWPDHNSCLLLQRLLTTGAHFTNSLWSHDPNI